MSKDQQITGFYVLTNVIYIKSQLCNTPPNVSSDAGRQFERHPAGDSGGRRHQELQQRHGRERPPQPLPAGEDVVRPTAGDVEPVQPGRRLAHHEREEGVSLHAARQAGQLLHQGQPHREQLYGSKEQP